MTDDRFAFGENWLRYLELVDEDRIAAARHALSEFLEVDDLAGRTFIDVGSGSGLMSLAARELGAEVLSFDYDSESVACTSEMRRRFRPDDAGWRVEQGSILDDDYVKGLGEFDVVYSWGVLHHTGDMAHALDNAGRLVAPGGRLFIAIYNDQGRWSNAWRKVKRAYNEGGPAKQGAIVAGVDAFWRTRSGAADLARVMSGRGRPDRTRERGMDRRRDLVDWVGGYPFEVAKPEEIFDFYRQRGFTLDRLRTVAGDLGCNEFAFTSR